MKKRTINLLNPGSRQKSFLNYVRPISFVFAVTIATVYVVYVAAGANTTIGNNISTSGTLTVGGTALFSGTLNASSTLQVTGTTTLYGKLAIGTTSPSQALSVQGNALISGDVTLANITATGTATLTNVTITGSCVGCGDGSGTVSSSTAAGQIPFYAASDSKTLTATSTITIASNQRVGIGTTSPAQKLSVQGNALFSGDLNLANITATGTLTLSGISGTSTIAHGLTVATSAGTFGVGTSTPAEKLAVAGRLYVGGAGTSTIENNLQVRGTLQTGTGSIYLGDTFVQASNGAFVLNTNATSTFGTNGLTVGSTHLVVQQTSGKVGIGTTVPSNTLTVSGNADFTGNVGFGTSPGSNRLNISGATDWSDPISGGSGIMGRGPSMGTIGGQSVTPIGYYATRGSAEGYAIGIEGSSGRKLVFGWTGTPGIGGHIIGAPNLVLGSDTDAGALQVVGSNVIASGKIGVATTSPSQTLAVQGNALFSGNISSVANITATGTLALTGTSGTSTIAQGQGFQVGTSQFVVNGSNGKVGLGTLTPQATLDVKETGLAATTIAKFRNSGGTVVGDFQTSGGSGILSIYLSDGSERIRLSSTGDAWVNMGSEFGVGNTNPQYKLDVGGDTNLSSGSVYRINGTSVLSASALGSGITSSSLTSVGALNSGSITSGFGSIDIGADTLTAGTTTINNLAVTNTSTSTFAGPIAASTNDWIIQAGTDATHTIHLAPYGGRVAVRNPASISNNFQVNGGIGANTLCLHNTSSCAATEGLLDIRAVGGGTATAIIQNTTNSSNASLILRSRTFSNQDWTIASIGSDSTGDLNISGPGGNVVRLTSSNNVGIGTTSPSQKLSVQGNALFSGTSTVAGLHATGTALLATTGGSVGIGTEAPANKLSVSGNANISGNLGVGANASAPGFPLHVRTTASATLLRLENSFAGTIDFAPTASLPGDSTIAFGFITEPTRWTHSAHMTSSQVADTYAINHANGFGILIDGSGRKFGIGTSTPSQTLAVQGNALFSGNISSVANITATGTLSLTGTSGTSTVASGQGFTVGDSQFVVQQGSGNVGIGTTTPWTQAKLHVYGASGSVRQYIEGDSASTHYLIFRKSGGTVADVGWLSADANNLSLTTNGVNGQIIFASGAGTEAMRINSSGNVGIGTTSPVAQLSVEMGTNPFAFWVGDQGTSTPAFTVTGAGRVGIGRALPSDQLSVEADFGVGSGEHFISHFTLPAPSSSGVFLGYRADGSSVTSALVRAGGSIPLTLGTSGANQAVTISNNGDVGIGTTTISKLSVFDVGSRFGAGAGPDDIQIVDLTTPLANAQPAISLKTANTTWSLANRGDLNESFVIREIGVADRFVINTGGNVGIGTTSPGTLLSLHSGSDFINFGVTSTSTFSKGINLNGGCFAINGTCVGAGGGSGTVNNGTQGQVAFYDTTGTAVSGTSTVFITTAQNVGIGSSSPSVKLDVAGEGRFDGIRFYTNQGKTVQLENDGDPDVMHFSDINDENKGVFFNFGSGSFGVGDEPHGRFSVGVSGDSDVYPSTVCEICFIDNSLAGDNLTMALFGGTAGQSQLFFGDSGDEDIGSIVYDHSSDSLRFTSNTSEQMRITSAGNVGIGTTSPSQKLSVQGSALFSGNISSVANITATGTVGVGVAASDAATLDITRSIQGGSPYLRITMVEGSIPDTGPILLNSSGTDFGLGYVTDNNSFSIKDVTAGSVRFHLDNLGKIGIGTSTPAYGLTVASKTAAFNAGNDGTLDAFAAVNSLSSARYKHSSAVANGYVYVIGGLDGSSNRRDTVLYAKVNGNGTIGPWSTNQFALAAARDESAAVVANGYLYLIGGGDALGINNASQFAKLNNNGSTGPWATSTSNLPWARRDHTAVVANGFVYAIGGNWSGGNGTTTINYAKLNSDGTIGAWATSTNSLPAARGSHGSVVVNGYVYVVGGNDSGGSAVSTVYYAKLNADGTLDAWQTANALPAARASLSATANNGYIYASGGNEGFGSESAVYFARVNNDGSLSAWASTNSLPDGRSNHTSVMVNGYVYSLGGLDTGPAVSAVNYYSSAARTLIAGSLDLFGLASTTLSDPSGFGSTGGSLFAGSIFSNGMLEVTGNTQLWNGLSVSGTISLQAATSTGSQASPVFSITTNATSTAANTVFSVSSTGSTTLSQLTINNNFDAGSTTPSRNTLYKENIIKGWVTFDGSVATIAIADAFNVSSITDNGTGDYTINWTTPFATANYSTIVVGNRTDATTSGLIPGIQSQTTTSARTTALENSAGGVTDCRLCNIIAIGDQ